MPIAITMPALSPTMTEGTLAKWMVKEGDTVSSGDVIAEIETDKATMEVEAADEGTVGRLLVEEGTENVAVNSPIALLLEEGEGEDALEGFTPKAVAPPPSAKPEATAEAKPAPKPAAKQADVDRSDKQPAPAPRSIRDEGGKAPPAGTTDAGERIFASPLARRLAAQAGLDLAQLSGSGPHGRIVRADVEASAAGGAGARAAAKAPAPVSGEAQPFEAPFELERMSAMRKIIARRMTESKQTVPHFYLSMDCRIDGLLDLRRRLNEHANGAYKLSVNDLVIKAAAIALTKVPNANVGYSDDGMKRYQSVDISVAVATERGLITPVIRQAHRKGLEAISNEMRELAAKARDGKLMPEDYQGGTFSISNLGMYGVTHFDAVINPPQACILAVGAGEKRPVVKDDELAIATVMTCTLSVDHRVVDGAIGAELLAAFRTLVEDPIMMLL